MQRGRIMQRGPIRQGGPTSHAEAVAFASRYAMAAVCASLWLGCAGANGSGASSAGDATGATTGAASGTASGAAATTTATGDSTGAPRGPSAPDFELPLLAGGTTSLAEHRGKVVLVDFWSTTCDPCLREMPELVKLYREKKARGFEVLAIATDGPDTLSGVTATAREKNMVFPVLLDQDTEVLDRYNPKGELPFTVVVDRHGRIVLRRAGYQPGDEESMRALVQAIDKALAEK